MSSQILWLQDITRDELTDVGEQAVQIGTLINEGFPFPDGFVIPSSVYFHFLHQNNLITKINKLLETVNYEQPESLAQVATHIKKLIKQAPLDAAIIKAIDAGYHGLGGKLSDSPVIISPSATRELVSFIGQPSSITVKGEANVIVQIRSMWAAVFEPHLILLRHEKHVDHFRAGVSVIVQREVQPESTGIMMTIDPVSNDTTKLLIETQKPSEYYEVGKRNLSLINKLTDTKQEKLTVNQVIDLATLGKELEKLTYFPQEIRWAIEKKKIMFLKTSPLFFNDQKQKTTQQTTEKLQQLIKGTPAAKGIAKGLVKKVRSLKDLEKISRGDILITHETTNAYRPTLKKASALIVETGGRTSHAAMIARELGIPAIVGANDALAILHANTLVTVDGTTGIVYKSARHSMIHSQTATHLYVISNNLKQTDFSMNEDTDGIVFVAPESSDPAEIQEFFTSLSKASASQPILYRLADHRSNLLGLQGMQKYLHEPTLFAKQLETIKRTKLLQTKHIALPVIRTVKEMEESKHLLTKHGIDRSPTMKLWFTVTTPANVIQLEEYIKQGLDGFVIDADMLTMLLLGIDKHISEVARYFDPTNPAVLWALEQIIKTANKHRLPVLIYGEGPSHHSSLIAKLVEWGITSIAVTPDVIHKTRREIKSAELGLLGR